MKRLFPVLLVLILGCKPAANPVSDLASPSQETRDAAAIVLRATAKPPPKIKWFFFIPLLASNCTILRYGSVYLVNQPAV
jgi:hypothetical protein